VKTKDKIELSWYLAICFGASFVLAFLFWNELEPSSIYNSLILALPGVTALAIYQIRIGNIFLKNGALDLTLKGFKYWFWAPAFVTLLCFLSYGISVGLHPTLLKSKEEIVTALTESGFYYGNIGVGAAAIILINASLGSLVTLPMYLGQELGWRAFMQPILLKSSRPFLAFLVGGAIWGVWSFFFLDLPLDFSTSTVVSLGLRILFFIPAGILFYYFYSKSQSIFAAALAHAALQQSVESTSLFLKIDDSNSHWNGPFGMVGIILFWLVALLLLNNKNWLTHTL